MAMRKKYKRYLFLFFSLAALLMGMSGTGVVFAQGHTQLASLQKTASLTCGAWSVVASPNGGSSFNVLTGVAAVSASDAWAVGNYLNSTDTEQTLIEHWDGMSWSVLGNVDGILLSVAALSASDIWAVGQNSNGQTLAEQWNGTSWNVVPSPNIGSSINDLSGVAAVSASDVWAVGYFYNSTGPAQTFIEQWNGTIWSVVSSPDLDGYLKGVAQVPGCANAWAVGEYSNSNGINRTLIEQYS